MLRRQTHPLPHWLVLVLLVLLTAGCGFKGRPLPLEKPLPVAPLDLEARQLGSSLLIAWTIPELNQDETPARDLEGFNLYRMLFNPQDVCPDCMDRSTLLAKIDLDYPVNVRVIDKRVYYFDRDIIPGKGYRYRIAARTRAGREGRPARARLTALPPIEAASGLVARGHDQMIRLSWEAYTPAPGDTLLGYQLYRGLGDGATEPVPVNSALLTATGFDDYGVENGLSYSYRLRSVILRGKTHLESPASIAAAATPLPGQ